MSHIVKQIERPIRNKFCWII